MTSTTALRLMLAAALSESTRFVRTGYDPELAPTTLPQKIAAYRHRTCLTQRQLGQLIGVNECTVQSWEVGGRHGASAGWPGELSLFCWQLVAETPIFSFWDLAQRDLGLNLARLSSNQGLLWVWGNG